MPGFSIAADQAVQFGETKAVEVRQRTRYGTDEPERDERSGLWVFDVFVRTSPPQRGSYRPAPSIEKVRVTGREAPVVTDGEPVVFVNLRAYVRVEEQKPDQDRSGPVKADLHYSADGIEGQIQKREAR